MSQFIEPTIEQIKDEKLYQEMGLTDQEFDKVQEILGRLPNYTEIGIFSVMWSEHCSYKHSKPFLKQFPTDGEHVLMGPGEGAGVVDIGDDQAVVFKVESHNHPSAVEPYQGAATGVGGIIRDIESIGARPVALLNSLRFGELTSKETKRLFRGVVSGIGGYGNCIGIPTIAGEIEFDRYYEGNPLVNAMCVGVIDHKDIQKGTAKGVGNSVIYVGLKTGRDGIHGATFASEELSEESESKRPSVQIGDPFVGKKLMEATLEAIQTEGLVGIQDMGAAGLTSSSSEMAAKGGSGIHLQLEKVPTREHGISPYEMMLSETQERMLLVVEKGYEQKFLDLFDYYELDSAVIGEVTDTDRFVLTYNDEVFADIPVQPLSDEAPVYILEGKVETLSPSIQYDELDIEQLTTQLIQHPTMANKSWAYEQYDSQVGANTIRRSGIEAGIVRVEGTNKALAVSIDGKARHVYSDNTVGGESVVLSAYQDLIATGAKPLAMTDCLNYGNPEKPHIYAQLQKSTEGMANACRILNTPVVSGNVSLYNETPVSSILPTPVVGMVGLIDDVEYLKDQQVKVGDYIYVAGSLTEELAGSQVEKLLSEEISAMNTSIDLEHVKTMSEGIRTLIVDGEINHVRPIGRGGFVVKLMQTLSHFDLSADIDVDYSASQLFSEVAGNYIIFSSTELSNDDYTFVGRITDEDTIRLTQQGNTITFDQQTIKSHWKGSIESCMTSKA